MAGCRPAGRLAVNACVSRTEAVRVQLAREASREGHGAMGGAIAGLVQHKGGVVDQMRSCGRNWERKGGGAGVWWSERAVPVAGGCHHRVAAQRGEVPGRAGSEGD